MSSVSAVPEPSPPPTAEEGGLHRAISRPLLLVFVVGDVLGAGVYALIGTVGERTGGAIWIAFVVALALAIFTAFAYAELVTKYPRAAGAALYVNKAFRMPFVSFMVAFAVMASGITSASTLSRAFGGTYLAEFITVPTVIAALVFIVFVAFVNARGIAESIKLNLALTTIEVGGLILVVIIAAAALGEPQADPGRAFDLKEGSTIFGVALGGAALAFYALVGFEDSVNVAEETKDPQRDYPFALFGGLIVAGIIYFIVAVLASMAVPTQQLVENESGALLEVAQTGPLGMNPKVFSAIALFALANGALINMIMASRLLYGMSNEGILPSALGGIGRRRTPLVAIAFTTLLAMVLIATGDLSELASTTVVLLLLVFITVNVSVLVLRRDTVAHSHFHAPSVMPIIGIVVSIGLLTQTEGDTFIRAGALIVLGVVLYFLNRFLTGPRGPLDTKQLVAIESGGEYTGPRERQPAPPRF